MKKAKKKMEIKNSYYLVGPLALVAFLLFDIVGGYNFPGYDWVAKVRGDISALNSYSVVYGIIFAVIYAALTCFAIYCLYRYFKTKKMSKLLNRGLKLFMIGSIVFAIGTTIFMLPEVGTFDTAKENLKIGTTTEVVDSESDVTETQEVFSMDATMDNLSSFAESVAHPLTIGRLLSVVASAILCLISLIFIIIGGFKKNENLPFCAVGVFCFVILLYSCVATLFMDATALGLNARFGAYAIVLFTCFLSSYIYVTDIKE